LRIRRAIPDQHAGCAINVSVRPLATTEREARLGLARGDQACVETETTAAELETAGQRLIHGGGVALRRSG